jgi:hypothetical protein
MAFGQKAFQYIQISNPEDTVGTAEAATEILFGETDGAYTDKIHHTPEQDRGLLAMIVETPFQVSDKIEFDVTGDLYDRMAIFMFNNGVRGNITPTQPDNINEPNHYLWTIEPGLTTSNTPDITNGIDTFTMEYGDNIQNYEVEYLFTTAIELTATVGEDEVVEFTWSVGGRQVTESTKTAALVAPSAAYFPANLTKFYIDTSYATLGTTQKTGMLRAFTWTFETGFSARYAADGNFYFSALNEERKKVELEMTYYRDGTNTEAAKDLFESQGTTYIRIELISNTEMDAAQANPEYIRLDGAYIYTEWNAVEEESGTVIETVKAESIYDTTAAKMMSVLIGTTMSAYA